MAIRSLHKDRQLDLVKRAVNNIRENEICFFWHVNTEVVGYNNSEIMRDNLKTWKQQKKQGILKIQEANNRTFEINGKKYYALVVQDTDMEKNPPIDPLAFGLGFHVSGLVYFFKNKKNRDAIVEYLNKDKKCKEEKKCNIDDIAPL